jgi:prepilin-type N-terminal cleavage/methylation domain-containing protein
MKNMKTKNDGLTLVELMITVLIASIAIVGISGVIAGSHRDYRLMFERIHGDIVNDAYSARLRFDKICRKARAGTALIDTSIPSLEVLYYSSPNVNGSAYLDPDRYARFYLSGTNLMLETAPIGGTDDAPELVARNVVELEFSAPDGGRSVQMVMTLDEDTDDDSDYSLTITCGAIMHN